MRRRLFTILSGLSLLLCVALCVQWARSLGMTTQARWTRPELSLAVVQANGVIGLFVVRDSGLVPPYGTGRLYGLFHWRHSLGSASSFGYAGISPGPGRWGFGASVTLNVGRPRGNWRLGGRRLWVIWMPFWVPILLTGLLPAFRIRSLVRGRRKRQLGHCRSCGYDLRATPDRCPECGTQTAVKLITPETSRA
ncbi:MAG TPA: hypothetical protein VFC78_23320 [Tepidisphaeraceae bacterium]|nr:hypothetical protein [Tepidisphaeraceae bacterium]